MHLTWDSAIDVGPVPLTWESAFDVGDVDHARFDAWDGAPCGGFGSCCVGAVDLSGIWPPQFCKSCEMIVRHVGMRLLKRDRLSG